MHLPNPVESCRAVALRHAISFLRLGVKPDMFASAMLPSEGQLQQMRERPWNGVQFSEDLESLVLLACLFQCLVRRTHFNALRSS